MLGIGVMRAGLKGVRGGLAAFAGGALSVAGFAPFSWFPLALAGVAVLVWLLRDVAGRQGDVRRGFGLGFAWGLGCFLFGVSWLYVALNRYGGVPAPVAGLAILLFCAYLALFPAVCAAAFVRLRRGGAFAQASVFAALWGAAELLRGGLLTGFPWLSLGYSQLAPSPLQGWFPVLGVYGVGMLAAFVAAYAVLTPWRQRRAALVTVAGIGIVGLAGAALGRVAWTQPEGVPLRVALVQTDIAQDLKWEPSRLQDWLETNLQLARAPSADLVVLPETTLPLLMEQLPAGYLDMLAADVRQQGGDLVLGVFTRDQAGHIYNAALSVGASPSQSYAKRHLVPFGEYSPPLFGWFYELANIPMSSQTPGAVAQAPLQLGAQRVAVNICYEDLFGRELIDAVPDATLLLNLSNLAWYGDSFAQPQHLQIAQARALETGRPMLRATNTGMTAIVMPDGEVAEALPAFVRSTLTAQVQGYTGLTPYVRWGDWGAAGLVLAGLAVALGSGRRIRRQGV